MKAHLNGDEPPIIGSVCEAFCLLHPLANHDKTLFNGRADIV